MKVAAVIPTLNEAPTIGDVVDTARRALLAGDVIVVDNESTDGTAEVAAAHGARVVSCPARGKGEAMKAGVAATGARCIVFLDGDLIGLRPDHVDSLVRPVINEEAGMVCGLFDRGPRLNPLFLNGLPQLTGQRAIRRDLFESLNDEDIAGYKVEAALNSRCADLGLPKTAFVCDGLWHRVKEEKYENRLVGSAKKIAMLLTAAAGYALYRIRRLRRPTGPRSIRSR
jgi:glycosyltransferase involved in cell wall biosynthesis